MTLSPSRRTRLTAAIAALLAAGLAASIAVTVPNTAVGERNADRQQQVSTTRCLAPVDSEQSELHQIPLHRNVSIPR
jgi:hypothetical protein